MEEQEIKQNFSNNLILLRKAKNLTQAQLAEKLNYSDKSISKWENGNVLPDIVTLSQVAEFFGVGLDVLLGQEKPKAPPKKDKFILITLLSCGLAVLLTIIAFIILVQFGVAYSWLAFFVGLTATLIVALVLSAIWFNDVVVVIFVSLLNWSTITTLFLILLLPFKVNIWMLFPVGFVFQVLILLGYILKERLKQK